MQAISPRTSRKLSSMGLLCAILVVCIHIQRPAGCDFWLIKWGAQGLSQIAVPFFFAMSGYLLLNHFDDRNWWRDAMRKRVKSLVIPFFCLNLFWWPIFYGCHAIGVRCFHADASAEIMDITLLNFLKGINILPGFDSPALGVLWYVRALLALIVVSPILVLPLRHSKWMGLVAVILIYVAWILQGQFLPWIGHDLSLRCLFFFTFGMFVRLYNLDEFNVRIGIVSLLAGVVLMVVSKTCQLGVPLCLMAGSLYTILLIVGLWSVMPAVKLPKFFSGKSFAIYVLHPMFIYLGGVAFKALGWWNAVNTDIGITVTVIGYTAMACAIAEFMRRKTPRLSQLFFGGH